MYGSLLGQIANAAPKPPGPAGPPGPPAALGIGAGPPPALPGLPPPPTGIGAMPVGDPSSDLKSKASEFVLAARELKGHLPALAPMLDQLVAQVVAAAKPTGAAGAPGANDGVKPPAPAPPESSSLSEDALTSE